jgi:hypothetical protein
VEGDIGIYGMAVLLLAYFSYDISVFSLKNCGITILEILRYTVFATSQSSGITFSIFIPPDQDGLFSDFGF